MSHTSAVVVLTRVHVASPRHTRQLRAVALSPEEATPNWCCSVHTAAVARCERRAGLYRTSCPFKKQSDTYRRTMIPPAPFFFWPSRRRKTYFNQLKAMPHETDGGLNNATRYRRSCSHTKKSPRQHFYPLTDPV